MKRVIYEVYAKVIDSTGAYNTLSGYPKVFDSKNYGNDTDKTFMRAKGEYSDTVGAMCKRDDRQLQSVMLISADGAVLMRDFIGRIADLPDPEANNEPE